MTDRTPTQEDLDTLSLQLGRPVRDVVEIPARCRCGNPLVAATAPRLSNGIPFPTTFYLTHPTITAAVSRQEADGVMAEMSQRLQEDEELAAREIPPAPLGNDLGCGRELFGFMRQAFSSAEKGASAFTQALEGCK